LRGVAAIFVVIYHMGASKSPSYPFASAYLAVDLFVLLSGFALSHAYDPRFAKGMTFSQFMRRRLAVQSRHLMEWVEFESVWL
jgi:peptidoglycan/LPS O-acetylase OafA/YrhL